MLLASRDRAAAISNAGRSATSRSFRYEMGRSASVVLSGAGFSIGPRRHLATIHWVRERQRRCSLLVESCVRITIKASSLFFNSGLIGRHCSPLSKPGEPSKKGQTGKYVQQRSEGVIAR